MEQLAKNKMNGLVLAGGKSLRMKTDKALLQYHGKNQIEQCFGLLQPLCEKIFLSIREDQSGLLGYKDFPQIHDLVSGIGPLGGILSALSQYPNTAWLILACDLPFVSEDTLRRLVTCRDPSKIATAYRSISDGLPEPLCAVYEPKSISWLLEFLTVGDTCPRKILMQTDACLIELQEKRGLENINSPDELEQALHAFRT